MKTHIGAALAGAAAGVLLCLFAARRYEVVTAQGIRNPQFIKLDRWTGKTWEFAGRWEPIEDAKPPKRLSDEEVRPPNSTALRIDEKLSKAMAIVGAHPNWSREEVFREFNRLYPESPTRDSSDQGTPVTVPRWSKAPIVAPPKSTDIFDDIVGPEAPPNSRKAPSSTARQTAKGMERRPRAPAPGLLVPLGGGNWIDSVLGDGEYIKLQDGSLWGVSPFDVIDSALWLPLSSITLVAGDDPSYPYKLINTDDNEIVNAKLISK